MSNETFTSIRDARRELADSGGVLLDLGDSTYAVVSFEEACEQRSHLGGVEYFDSLIEWDETRLRHSSGGGRGKLNDNCACSHHRP
jgi:hypothetical protein